MDLSVFDVLGPVMIGPSSSHTAGAAKLARLAAIIAAKPFNHVKFGLSGSFAHTAQGHGTDKALLAGAMGLREDDERIINIGILAREKGVTAEYYQEELEDMHENSVHITFCHGEGTSEIWGSSIGGGSVIITRIGDFDTEITAERPTIVVRHLDRPGVVSDVSRMLAEEGINIALMRLSREAKGKQANAVIEIDGKLPAQLQKNLMTIKHVVEVIAVDEP